MEVWIEIYRYRHLCLEQLVTPYVGVWIEIANVGAGTWIAVVTPYVGVWIEIVLDRHAGRELRSLPTWECGLKSLLI